MTDIIKFGIIENKIIEIRNQKVILDFDGDELYGVQTKKINQAVKNNPEKLSAGYVFKLNSDKKTRWSKFLTTSIKLNFQLFCLKRLQKKACICWQRF